ncbi:MAG: DUF2202 domain-containing protein [Pontiella sp.]|nr:DUF2202 domain-containing protein [Pontiella sp.]
MKTKICLMLCALAVLLGNWSTAAVAESCCCCRSTLVNTASSVALSADETHDLLLMREEEKLARDVYAAMNEVYSQRIFVNIPRAEQNHMDAVLGLLNAHGLADPAKEKPGAFGNKELQKLYNQLVKRGTKSREEAFLVGAFVEELDIQDLIESMKRTSNKDILAVYENLLGGSKRHLNAFVRNYEAASGQTYKAQRMSQTDVNAILGR